MIGVALTRSLHTVVALLGVLKTGAAYLPLDPAWPDARLALMLSDAEAVCVVTVRELSGSLPDTQTVLVLDDPATAEAIGRRAARDPRAGDRARPLTPRTTAYVIYTSGSTGAPKGVMIEQRALSAFFHAVSRDVPFAPGDRHVAVTSPAFDISIVELLLPLCHGAEVIVARSEEVHDPAALSTLIRRSRACSVQATPSYWGLFAEDDDVLGQVRVLVGGEPLRVELARALYRPGRRVCSLYGPTEATIWASAHVLTEADVSAHPTPQPLPDAACRNSRR